MTIKFSFKKAEQKKKILIMFIQTKYDSNITLKKNIFDSISISTLIAKKNISSNRMVNLREWKKKKVFFFISFHFFHQFFFTLLLARRRKNPDFFFFLMPKLLGQRQHFFFARIFCFRFFFIQFHYYVHVYECVDQSIFHFFCCCCVVA